MGAENINFVTPTHYADKIIIALDRIKHKLDIPVVYNTSGYEKIETLKRLCGYIDIYLPDLKYYSPFVSEKYSFCRDYYETAVSAIGEMIKQTGKPMLRDDGKMMRGTIIRHLVLPSLYKDSLLIFDELEKRIDASMCAVSVMCQYFPSHRAKEYPEINRRTTSLEYMKVVERVRKINFAFGFIQDKSSAKEDYVPNFDYK
jgi:putative pyruvate formate lyase activating enzyme